jgi:hypothetical protein
VCVCVCHRTSADVCGRFLRWRVLLQGVANKLMTLAVLVPWWLAGREKSSRRDIVHHIAN